jgi:hypothetical protein
LGGLGPHQADSSDEDSESAGPRVAGTVAMQTPHSKATVSKAKPKLQMMEAMGLYSTMFSRLDSDFMLKDLGVTSVEQVDSLMASILSALPVDVSDFTGMIRDFLVKKVRSHSQSTESSALSKSMTFLQEGHSQLTDEEKGEVFLTELAMHRFARGKTSEDRVKKVMNGKEGRNKALDKMLPEHLKGFRIDESTSSSHVTVFHQPEVDRMHGKLFVVFRGTAWGSMLSDGDSTFFDADLEDNVALIKGQLKQQQYFKDVQSQLFTINKVYKLGLTPQKNSDEAQKRVKLIGYSKGAWSAAFFGALLGVDSTLVSPALNGEVFTQLATSRFQKKLMQSHKVIRVSGDPLSVLGVSTTPLQLVTVNNPVKEAFVTVTNVAPVDTPSKSQLDLHYNKHLLDKEHYCYLYDESDEYCASAGTFWRDGEKPLSQYVSETFEYFGLGNAVFLFVIFVAIQLPCVFLEKAFRFKQTKRKLPASSKPR